MKKIVSLILALIMVLSCVPMASAAAHSFVAANISDISGMPEQPAIPEYTLETVDGKYVLTVEDSEKFTSNGNVFIDSRNENYDWDTVYFTYDEQKDAFISDRLLDLENYPEEPSLYFHLFNGETGMSSIQMSIETGTMVWSYVEENTEDGRGFYAWQPEWEEITVEVDGGSAYYNINDGSLTSYVVRSEEYDISYDPYGRINWVQGKIDMGNDNIIWVDWDFALETWVTWDPETGEPTPFETDLPAFDSSEYPALITLPFEVELAPSTIDVNGLNVWPITDEDGNVTGYVKDGKNCFCYYDLDGNMTSYYYNNLEDTMGVEYDLNGTMLYFWGADAEGNSFQYFDASAGYTDENGNVLSGWFTWNEDGERVSCDEPAGVEILPALTKPAVAAPEVIWYPYNTMCVAGISLKDTYGITDKWYNVVPVDLTKDGTYTFDLVASGMFLIGKANVTVADGNVTVTYGMPWGHGYIKEEVLNWFTSPSQITAEYCENPTGAYAFGEPVSISQDLGGADVGLLFICNRVTYRQPYYNSGAHLVRWYSNKPEWKAFREQLMTIMPE